MTKQQQFHPVMATAPNVTEPVVGFSVGSAELAVDSLSLVGIALTAHGGRRVERAGDGRWHEREPNGSLTPLVQVEHQGATLYLLSAQWHWEFNRIETTSLPEPVAEVSPEPMAGPVPAPRMPSAAVESAAG